MSETSESSVCRRRLQCRSTARRGSTRDDGSPDRRRSVAGVIASVDAPYLPFMEGPAPAGPDTFRWRLGVRPLDLRDWIELGEGADEAIAEKRRLNAAHPATVFAALDDVEAESRQVAEALLAHLRNR